MNDSTAHTIIARAKINLALHVTGRRADGYHLLDTLAAFPDFGDMLSAEASDTLSLSITGLFADGLLPDESNLVLKAARLLAERADVTTGARLILDKRLPVASGIGGGSADAAAALKLLNTLWRTNLNAAELAVLAQELGADVPMCLVSAPLIARGIGEKITMLAPLPGTGIVLVNSGHALSTPAVFKALQTRSNPPLPILPDSFSDTAALCGWLRDTRNDLEPPAIASAPDIAIVLATLRAQPNTLLARMSGSGATCFSLHASPQHAQETAKRLATQHQSWWIQAAQLQ